MDEEAWAGRARGILSVELLLDDATEAAVRADWERLAAAGHSSMAAHRSPTNRPHLTLLVRPLREGALPATLFAAAARLLPVPVVLAEPIVFAHGERGVLARRVVPTAALRVLHEAVHACAPAGTDAPHTRPPEWTPHVTLARRLRLADRGAALGCLGPGREGHGVGLRRWDSAAREATLVAADRK